MTKTKKLPESIIKILDEMISTMKQETEECYDYFIERGHSDYHSLLMLEACKKIMRHREITQQDLFNISEAWRNAKS